MSSCRFLLSTMSTYQLSSYKVILLVFSALYSFKSEYIMEISTRKPKISSTGAGIDRISSLPDDVLHKILSSLYIFDVVQLSVLSKRWRYIWTTMPYLHFDIDKFNAQRMKRQCDFVIAGKFKDFINWVLISQSDTTLVQFLLCFDKMFDKIAILRWINHVTTRRNVQQLVLKFCLGETFELPYCLVTCQSLQVLKLHLSGDVLKLPNHLGFRQLKVLHLEQVELLDERLISCLFSKCDFLITLILEDCSVGAMKVLDIASASLRYITLRNNISDGECYANCEIKISCPGLKVLKYNASVPKDIVVENLVSIEVVRINLVDRVSSSIKERGIMLHKMIKEVYRSTSVLKLCMTSILGLYYVAHRIRLSPVSFYKLKSLKLEVRIHEESMQAMILMLKYSPYLEVLKLWSDESVDWSVNWQLFDLNESIECLESHLKSIHLTGFKGEDDEIELLRFFLKNALVLEKLMIFWEMDSDKSEEVSEEILNFPRTSSHVVLTFLDAKISQLVQ